MISPSASTRAGQVPWTRTWTEVSECPLAAQTGDNQGLLPRAGLCPMRISAVIRVESGGALWWSTPSLALPDLYSSLTLPTETYTGRKGVGMETPYSDPL